MKTGRNDPCPCGSGNKYKKCCLEKDEAAAREAMARTAAQPPPPLWDDDEDEAFEEPDFDEMRLALDEELELLSQGEEDDLLAVVPALYHAARTPQQREAVLDALAAIDRAQYVKRAGLFGAIRIAAALDLGRDDVIEQVLQDGPLLSSADPEGLSFPRIVDLLAYHGKMDAFLRVLREGGPGVDAHPDWVQEEKDHLRRLRETAEQEELRGGFIQALAEDVPLSQAILAGVELLEYCGSRKKRILAPDAKSLEGYLDGLPTVPAVALFHAIPRWLEYLQEKGDITLQERIESLVSVTPVHRALVEKLDFDLVTDAIRNDAREWYGLAEAMALKG